LEKVFKAAGEAGPAPGLGVHYMPAGPGAQPTGDKGRLRPGATGLANHAFAGVGTIPTRPPKGAAALRTAAPRAPTVWDRFPPAQGRPQRPAPAVAWAAPPGIDRRRAKTIQASLVAAPLRGVGKKIKTGGAPRRRGWDEGGGRTVRLRGPLRRPAVRMDCRRQGRRTRRTNVGRRPRAGSAGRCASPIFQGDS